MLLVLELFLSMCQYVQLRSCRIFSIKSKFNSSDQKYVSNAWTLKKNSLLISDSLVHFILYLTCHLTEFSAYLLNFFLLKNAISRLDDLIETFLKDNDPDGSLDVGADMRKIKYCFVHMKVFF